jgi:hypothetical protein
VHSLKKKKDVAISNKKIKIGPNEVKISTYERDMHKEGNKDTMECDNRHGVTGNDDLWWPKIIVRTIEGASSWCFYFEEKTYTVFEVPIHTPLSLRFFTNADTMVLWEPGSTQVAIPNEGIDGRIVATVSPDISRYKEIGKKESTTFYPPCPSEIQIR